MRRSLTLIWFGALAWSALHPQAALAIQTHGHPEGLYVHQMAPVLFAGAAIFLIYRLQREGLWQVRGFRLLGWGLRVVRPVEPGHLWGPLGGGVY
jgi:hypothetical protein